MPCKPACACVRAIYRCIQFNLNLRPVYWFAVNKKCLSPYIRECNMCMASDFLKNKNYYYQYLLLFQLLLLLLALLLSLLLLFFSYCIVVPNLSQLPQHCKHWNRPTLNCMDQHKTALANTIRNTQTHRDVEREMIEWSIELWNNSQKKKCIYIFRNMFLLVVFFFHALLWKHCLRK